MPGTDGALALGMMRAVVDAGLHDDEWCRAHTTGFDDLLERLQEWPVHRAASITGIDAATIRRIGEEFASTRPSLLRLGVGGQRHAGAPMAYRTIACLPALAGSWRHDGGGCAYIPTACASAVDWGPLQRTDLRPGPVRTINMSQLGDALTDATLAPPVKALVVWNSNPAQVAPDQSRVLAGLRRDDLFTVVLDQFMTDTARFADVVLPVTTQLEHLDATFSWGHHYITYNDPAIAPLGESKPNTEVFRLLAAALGLDDPCFQESDEELLDAVFARAPEGITLERLRERGWLKVDLGQGPTPHAEGGFGTADGKVAFRADWLAGLGLDPLPTFDPPAEVADETSRRPLPARAPHSEDAFLPELDVRQPVPSAPGPARTVRRRPSGRRDGQGHHRRRPRAALQRPRRMPAPRPRERRRAGRRRRRPDELVDERSRWRSRRPGDDVAAADRAGPGPDVQRHPRRGRPRRVKR